MSQGGRQESGYGNGYGDDYTDQDEDYYTYDATDDEDEGRRRPLVILAIAALIVLFAGVVFLAYKQGLKQGALDNPPVIRADNAPLKVEPENPGGINIPHQDRSVYDRISGTDDSKTEADTEHLLPSAEEPIQIAPAQQPVTPPQASATTNAPMSVPESTSQTPPVTAPQTITVQPAPVTAAQPAPAQPAPTQLAPTPSKPVAASGGYVVQLAAFRDEPSAREAYAKLQGKYPSLKGLSADIQKADLGVKGIYYRLRAGYLSKADATALCGDLANRKQPCIVRPK